MRPAEGHFGVLIPAAGRSVRFGTGRSKLLEKLGGEPIIRRSVRAFLVRSDVKSLVIAASPDSIDELSAALGDLAHDPRVRFCGGGASRAESVRNALQNVAVELGWIAVHDAARPLVSQELIDRTFAGARKYGAAVPALPVSLTIKEADGPLPAKVLRTVPRQRLWAMQTPQVMRRDPLEAAFARCPLPLDQITDDVQLLELAGQDVWLVEGEERNLKITTAPDLHLAELMLNNR
jgi:2-C-methyl-D-erythritol 4-phosphate cytidylyltransferase